MLMISDKEINQLMNEIVGIPFASLNRERQYLFIVMDALNELDNGGIEQYYNNSSGDHADQLPTALLFFQLPKWAAVFEEANKLFKNVDIKQRKDRWIVQEFLSTQIKLDQLNKKLENLEDAGDDPNQDIFDLIKEDYQKFF